MKKWKGMIVRSIPEIVLLSVVWTSTHWLVALLLTLIVATAEAYNFTRVRERMKELKP